MANNQYLFYLIERKSLEDLAAAHQFIEGEELNTEPFWIYSHKPRSLFFEVDRILQKGKSWSEEIDLYGVQDSFCLEVAFDESNYITSATFRIDFKYPYEDILREMIEFCISKELVIIDDENGYNTELNYEFIDNIIQSSNQLKKYYKNPY